MQLKCYFTPSLLKVIFLNNKYCKLYCSCQICIPICNAFYTEIANATSCQVVIFKKCFIMNVCVLTWQPCWCICPLLIERFSAAIPSLLCWWRQKFALSPPPVSVLLSPARLWSKHKASWFKNKTKLHRLAVQTYTNSPVHPLLHKGQRIPKHSEF